MKKSESIENLTQSLIKFQALAKPVAFDAQNSYYNSKYASLRAVIDTIKSVAPDVGLAWTQMPISEDGGIGVETTILHESGEYISERILVTLPSEFAENSKGQMKQANLIQEAGKYISYLRRYALASAFGLYADEDTDGNAVTQSPPKQRQAPQAEPAPKGTPRGGKESRPYKPEQLRQALLKMAERSQPASKEDVQTLVGVLNQWADSDEALRHKVQNSLFGSETIKGVSPQMISAALAWLKPAWDSQSKFYLLAEHAETELDMLYDELS